MKIGKLAGKFPAHDSRGRKMDKETEDLLLAMKEAAGKTEALTVEGKDAEDRDRLARKVRSLASRQGVGAQIRVLDDRTFALRVTSKPRAKKISSKSEEKPTAEPKKQVQKKTSPPQKISTATTGTTK